MAKYNYLNLGCGKRYHKDWVNVDMVSYDPNVQEHNLLTGIPYPDNTFDVVYHSHILEHFSKKDGEFLIKECYRVLKKGGTIRIVVPDLEQIIRLYLKFLEENRANPTPASAANYDWMMIELYDQSVRMEPGGNKKRYLMQDHFPNEEFLSKRTGIVAKKIWQQKETPTKTSFGEKLKKFWRLSFWNKVQLIHDTIFSRILFGRLGQFFRAGKHRLSGELHYWMYDSYSLGRLLEEVGFNHPNVQTATESAIPDWTSFELDTLKDGYLLKPDSLFMEAKK